MGLGSAWLCVPLCLLSRTPPRAPFPTRVSGLVGEAAFEKSRGLRGEGARGRGRNPPQLLLAEWWVWRKIGREGVQPGQTKPSAGRAGCAGCRGPRARSELLRRLGKRTSAELSLVQPPQLAFVVLRYWQGRSDGEECVILHVSLVGTMELITFCFLVFQAPRMSLGFSRVSLIT